MKKYLSSFIFFLGFLFFVTPAFAHEAYVLTRQEFDKGLQINSINPFAALFDPSYLTITAIITICVISSYFLVILWSITKYAAILDRIIKKAKFVGPLIIRLAISSSFFYAAQANAVLGPELSLAHLPGGEIVRFLEFVIAFMVIFGVFVELAALIGLGIFLYVSWQYGWYLLTYLNYFGELIVLLLFGSRYISFDRLFFGKKLFIKGLEKFKEYETPIVRILYGAALIYAGYTIKFQHQILSVWVYNQYHLKDFFHASAEFIASGAGLSEVTIGLFIIVGFVMRFTILISLVFITLSLLYFHEMLWPHFMLYGISFSLLINSADTLTIDKYLAPCVGSILKKIFKPTRRKK